MQIRILAHVVFCLTAQSVPVALRCFSPASYEVVKRTKCLNMAAVTIPATAGVVGLWRRMKASPAVCTSGCFYSAGDASTEVLFARKISDRAHAIPSLRERF